MLRYIVALLALFTAVSAAQAKSLYWRNVDVDAQLDGNGVLHVAETQTYVFDGDWNGGERRFDIRYGQTLQLQGVDRIEGKEVIPLGDRNIAAVDQYAYDSANSTLRWRSRGPYDPPFDHRELTYRIRYTLSGVLRGRENRYQIAHDFAFPDRPGVIERFHLRFTLAPEWTGLESPLVLSRDNLGPGSSVIVRGELAHQGNAVPGAVIVLPSPAIGYVFVAVLTLALIALLVRFLRGESALGRFRRLTPPEAIDEAWLRQTVFSLPPEVVGAAWDEKVDAPEVAAILATLAHEKKIESTVQKRMLRKPKLTMRLLADRGTLGPYQRKVIDRLFFGGRTTTDTDAVRARYKGSGLDLTALIRGPIEQQLQKLPRWLVRNRVVNWKFDALAVVAALVLLLASGWGGGNDSALVSTEIFFGVISMGLGCASARRYCRSVAGLQWRFVLVMVLALPLAAETVRYFIGAWDFVFHIPVLVTSVLWNLAVFNLVLDALRIDQAPEKIAVRKDFAAARAFFAAQLRARNPRLHDDWFPYLIAFGLGANVDSWFRRYGAPGSASTTDAGSLSAASTSGSSGGTGWTGGGGTFGGAGATGSWALAAGAVAAGVSSSSGSSGGSGSSDGGGGGSSSGGGGGGGW